MSYYSQRLAKAYRDPHWTTARFNSKCRRCGDEIKKGAAIFYYPNSKSVYCDTETCGRQCSRQFDAEVQDENFYNSQYGPRDHNDW